MKRFRDAVVVGFMTPHRLPTTTFINLFGGILWGIYSMSIEAINFVMRLHVGNSSQKFVMLAMANYANEEGCAYPSCSLLESITELNRKTILGAIRQLIETGHISDTGQRKGKTGQVIVYQINGLNSTKNGTVPKTEQYRIFQETVPNTGHGTLKEPPIKKEAKASKKNHGTAFDEFWAIYPKVRAGNKDKAAKALYRAMDRAPFEEIMAGLRAYVDSGEPFREGGKYAKGAEAWLNDDRWAWSYGRNTGQLAMYAAQSTPIEDVMF